MARVRFVAVATSPVQGYPGLWVSFGGVRHYRPYTLLLP